MPRQRTIDLERRDQREDKSASTHRQGGNQPVSRQRSLAMLDLLKRESRKPASRTALAQQARAAARQRTPTERSSSAKNGKYSSHTQPLLSHARVSDAP